MKIIGTVTRLKLRDKLSNSETVKRLSLSSSDMQLSPM